MGKGTAGHHTHEGASRASHAAPARLRKRHVVAGVAVIAAALLAAAVAIWTRAAASPEGAPAAEEEPAEVVSDDMGVAEGSDDGAEEDADADDAEGDEVVSATTESGISYAGSPNIEGSDALAALEAFVAECQSEGIMCSITCYDLDGGVASLTYQPDATVYSASAIKGPYCLFVYQDLVEGGSYSHDRALALVTKVIRHSDNDAYRTLRSETYRTGFSAWLGSAGISVEGRENAFDEHWYAEVSSRELALAWQQGYAYLTSGTDCANELAGLFEQTIHSPIHEVLGSRYEVWSKAGWFQGYDGDASPAMNDAGIVLSDTGPYVIAVCTDSDDDLELVERIVDAVGRCHGELAGGDSSSALA
ncbi:MAG: class A beta-lactamase-related serine hydrolase [Atopobiaceae bacterium]|jgi:hypothetical protein|nr:class A beta-lactamase-related serine hydrolase [Atopobiaceae bacterium]MCH4119685.1 class A beta-lactamase-related serine hydrolase [Atopobiaceae bacterium]MCI1388757.1 class A beta-lactamase-related serine hydrolase [Atopobiaceae bacterium]MCI1432623.1 class A beta-lactamase-related serine hydrolase [Atopobiaceae bacterium]MCI1471040.1 class A beta-lactamase-related serine hydrolase [Atopobiaceae bacterium]